MRVIHRTDPSQVDPEIQENLNIALETGGEVPLITLAGETVRFRPITKILRSNCWRGRIFTKGSHTFTDGQKVIVRVTSNIVVKNYHIEIVTNTIINNRHKGSR